MRARGRERMFAASPCKFAWYLPAGGWSLAPAHLPGVLREAIRSR